MNCLKYSKNYSAKCFVFIVCLLTVLTSCKDYKEADSIDNDYFKVTDSSRDTVFSIANQKLYDAVNITMNGILSDTSVIAVSTDSTFMGTASFYVPSPNIAFSQKMDLTDIKSEFLFIKYHPIRKSNSGDLKIEVTFL